MSEGFLSASGEAAWQSLRQHIEWTQGFWIGWVFTDHAPSVHELHQRIEGQLRAVGRSAVIRQAREPGELVEVLTWLLAGAEGCDGCVTVAVVRQEEAWQDAWDQFLLRLNERRELLRQQIRAGLLLCAPTRFKARSRAAAPDLWSIRSLALDVAPITTTRAQRASVGREDERNNPPGDPAAVTLALQAVTAAQRVGQAEAETEAHIRAAQALFAVGRRDEGREHAVYAVERATTAPLRARALVLLADLERRLEDLVASERHYRAAIAADEVTSGAPAHGDLSQLLLMRGALDEAHLAAERALVLSQERRARLGDSVETLGNVAASFERRGDVLEAQCDWSGAEAAYKEALALSRRIRVMGGDTAEALKNEATGLARTGDVRRLQGDLSGAGAAYAESLALSRRVREMGETVEALRQEASSLYRVGDILRVQENWGEAGRAYEEGLALSRQICGMVGDTAEALRDVLVGLERVGDVSREQGDWSRARVTHEEGLALSRRIREIIGNTVEALRDLSLSLDRWGLVLQAQGDWSGAGMAYGEGLALTRQIRGIVGDRSWVVDDLELGLQRCAAVHRHQGRLAEAREMLQEAVELLRGIHAQGDESPRVSVAVQALADVLRDEAALRDPLARP